MTQLTIQQTSPAIAAYESTKTREMTDAELFPIITQQAQKVCAFSGQLLPDNPTVFAALVAESLRQQGCTVEQFKLAVKMGMLTTEIYSANAPHTYTKWVKQYLESVKQEIINYKASKTPVKVYSEEEKLQMVRDGVMKCFDKFKSALIIEDAGDAVYLYLEGKGVIDIPIEVKQSMFEQARPAAIERVKFKQQEVDRFTAKSLQRVIESAIMGNAEDMVVYEQKKICRTKILKDLFAGMTREELENAI